jgi:hypothetical protein
MASSIFDPVSPNDLGTSNVGDAGIFTQGQQMQAPIFPTQMGAYQVGQNPVVAGAQQALQANTLQHGINQDMSQVATLQQGASASILANQIAAAKIQQGMQQNAQDQYWHNQSTPGLNQQFTSDAQRQQTLTGATNQFALQNLQSQNQMIGLQAQQSSLPLQSAAEQAQYRLQGNAQNTQFANLSNNLQNYSQYNPDFRSMTPLDNQADPTQLANVQQTRYSNIDPNDTLGIKQQLQNGQPLKPEDVITSPQFLQLQQQDPQKANNISIGLFGIPAANMQQRLIAQRQAQVANDTSAANEALSKGTVRRGADGFLQKNVDTTGVSPQWKDAGSDQFPIEQASIMENGIQSGRTGIQINNNPAAQVAMAIMQKNPGMQKADALTYAKQAIANRLQGQTANQVSQVQDQQQQTSGLRQLTPEQAAMYQTNPPSGGNQAFNYYNRPLQ